MPAVKRPCWPTAPDGNNFSTSLLMLRLCALVIACLCAIPLLGVVVIWAIPLSSESQPVWAHVLQVNLPIYMSNTLWLMLGVAVISGCLGVGAAWCTTMYHFPLRRLAIVLWMLPLALPGYVLAISYGRLLDYAGPVQSSLRDMLGAQPWIAGVNIRTLPGAALLLGLAFSPYVFILTRMALLSMPEHMLMMARSFGLPLRKAFWRIVLPYAWPMIAGGLALALMETLAEFGLVSLFGVPTLAAGVYRTWFFLQDPGSAARLAGLMVPFVLLLLWLEWWMRRARRYDGDTHTRHSVQPLRGWMKYGMMAAVWLPVVLSVIIPVGYLLYLTAFNTSGLVPEIFLRVVGQTLLIGLMAGGLCALTGLALVLAARHYPQGLTAWLTRFTVIGYALPGIVVAMGALAAVLLADRLLISFQLSAFLATSLAGLMIAYLIRYHSVAVTALKNGAARITPEMEQMARSLGASPRRVAGRITLPLLKFPLLAAVFISFAEVIKELPAALILRPFDTTTLAIIAYQYASDDRLVEAAPYALMIVLIGLIAAYLLSILMGSDKQTVAHHG